MHLTVSCPECHHSATIEPGNGTHSVSGDHPFRSVGPGIFCPLCSHPFAWINGKAANLNGRTASQIGIPKPPAARKEVSNPDSTLDAETERHDYSFLTYNQLRALAIENGVPARGKRKVIEADLQAADVSPPEPTE